LAAHASQRWSFSSEFSNFSVLATDKVAGKTATFRLGLRALLD
jgi:hypothetical protein